MSVLKTYSIHIRRLSQHIPYGTPAEELLDDLSIMHDCQDIIEASQREALADTLDYWAIEMRSMLEESS